ncbi:thiaminase/transcriptional activator TenA [Azospirillum lipoferum]|uniref:Aminopyrimidine aminohydrolase n=1 Tax=Azospirillum lipoferum TaxID=193 RepID=A0A5A9GPZ8_AZOLI|nr:MULTISPECIES: thiaminase II [Azospirillum]KAA0596433.1 thiaminase II [Azospirillum lipoferum]MCP1610420.1 thiaminase/transcriptional activator TenA [Azospirillum lipoferum]MDW5538136.1 thiaminase II [Azospirillum sp. NL1]
MLLPSHSPDLFDRFVAEARADWAAYVDHAFVRGMGDGTLPQESFRHYLVQDYLFLIHFARAYALAIYKGRDLREMQASLNGLKAILDVEMDLHVGLCAGWGLSAAELERAAEAKATMAYTRYVLETGLRGDLLDLHVALSPCVIGYAEIGRRLAAVPGALDDANPYRVWIAEYAGEAYQEVARAARENLDRLAAEGMTEARFPRLVTIFRLACRLEADFWEMGMTLAG